MERISCCGDIYFSIQVVILQMEEKTSLHICHILFTTQMGGLEQAYLDYTKALLLCGHKITAVISPDAPYHEELEKLRVKIIFQKIRGFYDIFAWLSLRKLFFDSKPDLILAHNGRAIYAASWALLGINIPLIGVSHSNNLKYSKKADRLLVLTESMKKQFVNAGYPSDHCVVMKNMIDLPLTLNAKKWQKHTPPTVGFLGRLVPEKGADDLIKAIAALKNKNHYVKLKIAGTGIEEANLRSLAHKLNIKEQIEFCGWIAEDSKSEFFEAVDVLCVPSIYEPFGLVILEAWKHNVPVIASDTEGAVSIISNNINGLLYPKGDYTTLAENIKKLIFSEEKLAQNLINEGIKSIVEYGMEKSAQRLEKLLFSIMK